MAMEEPEVSEKPVPPPRFKKLARLAAAKERRSVTWVRSNIIAIVDSFCYHKIWTV